jgi:nitrogen fixation/metabolism regulation signal transduction histidine kinase
MQEQVKQRTESFLAVALLDSRGTVVAVNQEWNRLAISNSPAIPGSSLAEITAKLPELVEWAESAPDTNREFNIDDISLTVQLLPLNLSSDMVHSLLLVTARPTPGGVDAAARLRHDIKNRIGGLKLYASFLKRKLADQTDLLDVVNKMSDSLDQMNMEANKIRF